MVSFNLSWRNMLLGHMLRSLLLRSCQNFKFLIFICAGRVREVYEIQSKDLVHDIKDKMIQEPNFFEEGGTGAHSLRVMNEFYAIAKMTHLPFSDDLKLLYIDVCNKAGSKISLRDQNLKKEFESELSSVKSSTLKR